MIEKDLADQAVEKGETLMREGRYEEAFSLYRSLVEEHPAEDSFLLHLAWAYHDGGRLPEAMACFERLLERELRQDIFTGFAYDELVRIYKAEGLYERLISVCEKAVAAQPEDAGYLGDLLEASIKAGLLEKAVQCCLRMIEIDPAEADFYCRLGNVLILKGDWSGGEDAYKKAAEMDISAAGAIYYKLSESYRQAGQFDRAEAAQRQCLAVCPDRPLYHLHLGDILAVQGKCLEARKACEAAVRLNPAQAALYYNRLGKTLLRARLHEKALDLFLQALALEPDNPFYYLHAAECCQALGLDAEAGQYRRQADACRQGVKSGPSSSAPL